MRKYREEHKEQLQEYFKNRYKADQKRLYAQNHAYRLAHYEQWREYDKNYRQQRKDHYKAMKSAYYNKNKDNMLLKSTLYRRLNPHVASAIHSRRRARLVNSKGNFTSKEWKSLKAFYGNICLCCKKKEPDVKLTADHVIPLSRGGTNDISNIQPLCGSCNSRKYTDTTDYRLSFQLEKE